MNKLLETPSDKQSSGFTGRIARSFLLLAILTVSMVGTVAYLCGRLALKDAAYNRLSMTATLKKKEIIRWLESCEEDFLLIAQFPTVTLDMQTLLSESEESESYQRAYQRLSTYFLEVQANKPKFTEIAIQAKANRIILSTDDSREEKYEMASNLTELSSVIEGENFSPNFYLSPETGRPAITYASKIYDDEGNRQGMILADLNLQRIDEIISERTGLDETGETYLVGSLANQNAFLSQRDGVRWRSPSEGRSLPQGLQSDGITAAFNGENGQGIYDNYAGEPVIGVYRWLAGQDIALLAEMGEAEAFAPARNLATTIVLVSVGAAGILLVGVGRLARQLSRSRRQIERYSHQLEQTAAESDAANRAKSDFLANMSHELRTPLNAILGFAQLIQRDSERYSPHSHYLGIISRSGEHLLNLINDVLSMSKIEAGRTTFDPVCFDLRQMLLTLEEMLTMKAEAKGIQLSVRIDEAVPQFIKTDEVKLRQVLVNLIGNAIKFTKSGQVVLRVSQQQVETQDSLMLSFSVEDTGCGIKAEELTHLFDPFFQAASTRTKQQGTGLGLSISQRFVEMMGGHIHVQSRINEGSTFSFSIQAESADPKELPALPLGQIVGIAPEQQDYRILVVEDTFSARQLMVSLLSQVGFDVQAVSSGKEAIFQYKTWHPHLIWMDVRMPEIDGYEATREIKALAAEHSPVKIIAITANAFEKERKTALENGCDDFVRKPFQTHTIFEKMAEHLGIEYLYKQAVSYQKQPVAKTVPIDEYSVTNQPSAPESLQADRMQVMPPDWLTQFRVAAIAVDAEALYQLIDQIPAEHADLADALSHLVQTFCFDELVELTRTYA